MRSDVEDYQDTTLLRCTDCNGTGCIESEHIETRVCDRCYGSGVVVAKDNPDHNY